MKSIALLIFLLVFIPGSGRLIWDGIPLNNRAELAVLAPLVVFVSSHRLRDGVRGWLERLRYNGLVRPTLVLLCFLKLLSFAWSPLSQGFEACYRSLYVPLADPRSCEKSFNAPFQRADGLPNRNSSRVDPIVDFGQTTYDWSLPFMNEYPRLGAQWLERLPFSASYFGVVSGSKESDLFLPIYGNGEVTASLNNKIVFESTNYERSFLGVVPIKSARSELLVTYKFRDDDSTDPEVRPIPRGPYAQLKIGKPIPLAELTKLSRLRVIGTLSTDFKPGTLQLTVRDRDGNSVKFADLNDERTTQQEPPELPQPFDLEIELPAAALLRTPLEIVAGNSILLGTVLSDPTSELGPHIKQMALGASLINLEASLTADRNALVALTPSTHDTPGLPLRGLLILIDLAVLAVVGALLVVIMRTMRHALLFALCLAGATWLAIVPLDDLLPAFAGGGRELVIPYALVALVVVLKHKTINQFPVAFLLPTSLVLATQKVFEHVYFNHPELHGHWWGKLLFHWRDSDWFANEGLARSILVEGSLRGGESVFWFRAGPRYLIYASQLMFGENQVIIGITAVSIGFLVVLFLATQIAKNTVLPNRMVIACLVAFICLIFIGDQLIVAFGFFLSSEYPTWIGVLAVTIYLLNPQRELRSGTIALVAVALGVFPQFRPNSALVSVALMIVVLWLKIDWKSRPAAFFTATSAVTAFLIAMSLSLLHNLYYGGVFVPFTPNPTRMYVFDIRDVFKQEGLMGVVQNGWTQFAAVMYWRVPNDANFAIFFWGCQTLLASSLLCRIRSGNFGRPVLLAGLLPLTYVLPMLPFELKSYYPRLIVSASLLCLVSALLVWPRGEEKAAQTT